MSAPADDRHVAIIGMSGRFPGADDVEALNAFVLHYGPTLRMVIHAATDVQSGIAMLHSTSAPRQRRTKGRP